MLGSKYPILTEMACTCMLYLAVLELSFYMLMVIKHRVSFWQHTQIDCAQQAGPACHSPCSVACHFPVIVALSFVNSDVAGLLLHLRQFRHIVFGAKYVLKDANKLCKEKQ